MLLHNIKKQCPGLITDLLIPRSEKWMGLDVVTYTVIHRGRLACTRAVHLHLTQLSEKVVSMIRENGIEVHAWNVNDETSLRLVSTMSVVKFSTDKLEQALDFRNRERGAKSE